MPSNDDEVEYSVFGNDAANGPDGSDDGAGTDADAAGFAHGDDDGGGCPKCGGEETETDEIATSGTGLTKLFDVQNRQFVVVSCADCGYSELYKGQSTGNAIDFFIG
jgi:predicted nucleic-acid-binding Zn-ribbon protein